MCIRLLEVSSNWSGVLRFGFTSVNPSSLSNSLPKYVCPDLTSRPGFWAKALPERLGMLGHVLHFSVTPSGDVNYGMNGVDHGTFLSGVDTRNPLWVVVDVYGNSTALQFVNPNNHLNNRGELDFSRKKSNVRTTNGALSNRNSPSQPPCPYPAAGATDSTIAIDGMGKLQITEQNMVRAVRHQTTSDTMPLIVHKNVPFSPISFHTTKGAHISFKDSRRTVAVRKFNEYSNGYVFTERSMNVDEKIVLQVLDYDAQYVGAMAFGVTSADPATLSSSDLPEDCDDLLDRSEYWVVCKDVAASPKPGDELSFTFCQNGQIMFQKNNGRPHVIMHVDATLKFFAFFDIFGNTTKVRVLGTVKVTNPLRAVEQDQDTRRTPSVNG